MNCKLAGVKVALVVAITERDCVAVWGFSGAVPIVNDMMHRSGAVLHLPVRLTRHLPNTPNTCLLYTSDAADE